MNKKFDTVNELYQSSDYKRNQTVSKGLADTHEQVSDSYMTGDVSTNQEKEKNR
jgi:hypothetical protein|nr:YozQ family protein [uncultured Bacillus sp.]